MIYNELTQGSFFQKMADMLTQRFQRSRNLRSLLEIRIKLSLVIASLIAAFLLGILVSRLDLVERQVEKTALSETKGVDGIKINLNAAHLASSIKISAKDTKAPVDKKFLVIFTEAENASSSAKQVPYGNWFRLDMDGKKSAPLPLNSTFTIPPQATLEKQIVFIVDRSKNNFKLLVGQLDKEQKSIEINF